MHAVQLDLKRHNPSSFTKAEDLKVVVGARALWFSLATLKKL